MRRPKPIEKPILKSIRRCFVQLHRHTTVCRNSGPMKISLDGRDGADVECVECGRVENITGKLIAVEMAARA